MRHGDRKVIRCMSASDVAGQHSLPQSVTARAATQRQRVVIAFAHSYIHSLTAMLVLPMAHSPDRAARKPRIPISDARHS